MAQSSGSIVADRIRQAGRSTLRSLLDLIYPPQCPICEAPLHRDETSTSRFVCTDCLGRVEWFAPPWCEACGVPVTGETDLCSRCGHTSIPFEKARAVGPYDDVLARLIQMYKFQGERALAHDLAQLLAKRILDERMDRDVEAIAYVPMTQRALRDRGFNHVEWLARDLSRQLDRPVVPALHKIRETRPQVALPERERLKNLRGAFSATQPLPWASVLLIDDVFTTGATLRECSRALTSAGVNRVYIATLAHTSEDP